MSSSFFGSITSEQRWTDQFNEHFIIYIDNHASIFHVPKKVCDTKPEAYAPQQIGLGAYHHLRPDLDEMNRRKLEAVKKFLKPEQYRNFKSLIVDKVKVLEPSVRACYSKYLDIDGSTLAWIMSIDGVYLLHILHTYSDKGSADSEDRKLAQDIVMLENQVPMIILEEILKAMQLPVEDEVEGADDDDEAGDGEDEEDGEGEEEEEDAAEDDDYKDGDGEDEEGDDVEEEHESENEEENKEKKLNRLFLSFCKAHAPLGHIDEEEVVRDTSNPHLLGYMYNLIKEKWSVGYESPKDGPVAGFPQGGIAYHLTQIASVVADLTGQKPLQLLSSLPLQQLAALFKEDSKKGNSSIEEIHIPSASQLDAICKVKFQVWLECTSLKIMEFNKKNRVMYLPAITLNTDSEVILRNLVAYEVASASPGSTLILAGYVDFMCGIIDTAKDVDLLKEEGIIESDLLSEEIAEIFNGISKSSSQRALPELEEATQKLNMIYDSTFRVRALRFIRDHLIPSEDAVKLFLAILLILLLILQAVCQVYGCSARWFGRVSSI